MARESKRKRDAKRFGKAERLIDIALQTPAEQWAVPPAIGPGRFDIIRNLQGDLATVAAVVADNVGDYFFEHPKEYWAYKTDFPCVAPPFSTFFVEIGRPARVVLEDAIIPTSVNAPLRSGYLFDAVDAAGKSYPKPLGSGAGTPFRMELIEGGRWYVRALPLFLMGAQPSYMPVMKYFAVNERGEMIEEPSTLIGGLDLPAPMMEGLSDEMSQWFMPCLLAVSFMNCRNTVLTACEPDAAFNRERQKAGLRPFVRYHTINIEPMKTVLKTEGGIEANGLKKALHICRGHFAHYTEDRPLFGRPGAHGSFWVPSHVRGSAKQGVALSDYTVEASR